MSTFGTFGTYASQSTQLTQPLPTVGPEPTLPAGTAALTAHARQRCARRGISSQDIDHAWAFGRLEYRSGARFLFMGRREVETACACGVARKDAERCRSLVVLLADDGSVITTYKNDRALADIRRKKPYDKRRR